MQQTDNTSPPCSTEAAVDHLHNLTKAIVLENRQLKKSLQAARDQLDDLRGVISRLKKEAAEQERKERSLREKVLAITALIQEPTDAAPQGSHDALASSSTNASPSSGGSQSPDKTSTSLSEAAVKGDTASGGKSARNTLAKGNGKHVREGQSVGPAAEGIRSPGHEPRVPKADGSSQSRAMSEALEKAFVAMEKDAANSVQVVQEVKTEGQTNETVFEARPQPISSGQAVDGKPVSVLSDVVLHNGPLNAPLPPAPETSTSATAVRLHNDVPQEAVVRSPETTQGKGRLSPLSLPPPHTPAKKRSGGGNSTNRQSENSRTEKVGKRIASAERPLERKDDSDRGVTEGLQDAVPTAEVNGSALALLGYEGNPALVPVSPRRSAQLVGHLEESTTPSADGNDDDLKEHQKAYFSRDDLETNSASAAADAGAVNESESQEALTATEHALLDNSYGDVSPSDSLRPGDSPEPSAAEDQPGPPSRPPNSAPESEEQNGMSSSTNVRGGTGHTDASQANVAMNHTERLDSGTEAPLSSAAAENEMASASGADPERESPSDEISSVAGKPVGIDELSATPSLSHDATIAGKTETSTPLIAVEPSPGHMTEFLTMRSNSADVLPWKARQGSLYIDVTKGALAVKQPAAVSIVDGKVVINAEMRVLEPLRLPAKRQNYCYVSPQYPDGTFLPYIPVSSVVLHRNPVHWTSESYAHEDVQLSFPKDVFDALISIARRAYRRRHPGAVLTFPGAFISGNRVRKVVRIEPECAVDVSALYGTHMKKSVSDIVANTGRDVIGLVLLYLGIDAKSEDGSRAELRFGLHSMVAKRFSKRRSS